jgi:multisubunit Na+/H+ antiporter MnhB subunit
VVSPILAVVAPRLLGPAIMVGLATVIKGYADVGDGFSAAVIVTLAISLRYVTLGWQRAERSLPVLRYAPQVATAGLLIALAVGFFPMLQGNPPFTHLPGPGEPVTKIGTLELITPVLFDLGLFLLVTGSLIALVHNLARLVEGPSS